MATYPTSDDVSKKLAEVFPDEQDGVNWLFRPTTQLSGKCPADLLGSVPGSLRVINALDDIQTGKWI